MVAISKANGNTNGQALAQRPAGGALIPTLLGGKTEQEAPRFPIGGHVRAGIKVLTRKAAENATARKIYDDWAAQGRPFDEIEREILARCEGMRNPLTPKNVPYFTVRGSDFNNPTIAKQIMDLYGEDRGQGRRLYRFPVIFPADAWQHVMPHEMVMWTSSERRFWSEYSPDGQTRYCMTHEPVPLASNGQRTIRIWGGRKKMRREENDGVCDPEVCAQYQAKQCNLAGRFIFYIPGIESSDAFDLPTNSFYAMQAAIERFQTIGFMRGGRISGFLDGKRTPFYLSKRLVEVSRIDEQGHAVRTPQWLIELEAPIDVTALLRHDEDPDETELRAAQAAAVLNGQAVHRSEPDEDGVIEMEAIPAKEQRNERAGTDHGAGAGEHVRQPVRRGTDATDVQESRRGSPAAAAQDPNDSVKAASSGAVPGKGAPELDMKWILDAAEALGVAADRYEQYADKKLGKGWRLAAGGRKRAIDELSNFADDAEGFQRKVDAELDVFS